MWAVYYQSVLLLISLIYVSRKAPEYRAAWCALALWLPLCMVAQDITGELTPPLIGISIAALLCPLAVYAAKIGRSSVGLWVYMVFILSMIADLMFFVNNRMGSNVISEDFFKHVGGLLFCIGIAALFSDEIKRWAGNCENLFNRLFDRNRGVHSNGINSRALAESDICGPDC